MSAIADLVGLARGRYGPGVPATPKPGANAPAPWPKPTIMGESDVADAVTGLAAPAMDDLPPSPVYEDPDPTATPAPSAPRQAGAPPKPRPVNATRTPVPTFPVRPGSGIAGTPDPSDAPPGARPSDTAPTREPPVPPEPLGRAAKPSPLPEPVPRGRPSLDGAADRLQRPSRRPADEPTSFPAPQDRLVTEGAIAESAPLQAARVAEATQPTRPLASRAEAATENDRTDRRPPVADDAEAVRPAVRITIGRIDIQVSGAETPSPGRARSALSDAARLRRAGVRRL